VTPEQVDLVVAGMSHLRPRLPYVADAFYRRLFERYPPLRSMFPDDLDRQRQKFADELHAIVHAIPDMPAFMGAAAQLGQRHNGYGVRVAHYHQVRGVLLDVIGDELGVLWTPEAQVAWQAAYDMITEAMQLSHR
jgi:hemoglobin-like flavoprotein